MLIASDGNHGDDSSDVRTFELLTPDVTDAGLVKPYLARRGKKSWTKKKRKKKKLSAQHDKSK